MSDWRECELERIGAVILDAGLTPADPVEATCGPWRLLWSWDGVSIARVVHATGGRAVGRDGSHRSPAVVAPRSQGPRVP